MSKCAEDRDGIKGGENPLPPLIAHIIYKLDVGGLENGLVNLINNMPNQKYRHVIICLTDFTDFRDRITRLDVECYSLNKRPGNDFYLFYNLWKLLRDIRPDIVHTRNLTALECQMVALLSGVKRRVHSEHGRDLNDIDGKNAKYTLLRKLFRPVVHVYIALSKNLEHWLLTQIHVNRKKLVQIYNGVDVAKFSKHDDVVKYRQALPEKFHDPDLVIIGTVGRMQPVKDQITLVKGFSLLLQKNEAIKKKARLVLVGDGPLLDELNVQLTEAGLQELVWLAGQQSNIALIMKCLDIFVLPSINEGISNTVLEAMASGIPVVATNVGGNPELVIDGETGRLIPTRNPEALADALEYYVVNMYERQQHGNAARKRCEKLFSLDAMVDGYLSVYDQVLCDLKSIGQLESKFREDI